MTDQGLCMKNPAHPGEFVREMTDGLGLPWADAAAAVGVTGPALADLVNGRAPLSSDMALRLEKAFGVSRETLMRMQINFDRARTNDLS